MHDLLPQLCPLLVAAGFQHGFFGRLGGVSRGAYHNLNCSYSVGDDPSHVTENLARIAHYLEVPQGALASVSQVHSSRVAHVDATTCLSTLRTLEADALVLDASPLAVCVRTADCVPVLVGCRATGMVAAIHAGWRGIVGGIVPRTIDHLMARGSTPSALVAGIGPHIGVAAFEVSPEVAEQLHAVAPLAHTVTDSFGIRPHVRLAGLVRAQLESRGLTPHQIDEVSPCTFSNPKEFFSYRRDGGHSGRQLSAIRPLPSVSVFG